MQVERTRMYRVRDVAEHFDVSVATIYRAIESGQLDALKLGTGTGTFRVTGSAVLAYMQACTQAAIEQHFSPAQADGLACVVCGADFLAVRRPRVPIGRSASGSQTFVCTDHINDNAQSAGVEARPAESGAA